MDFIDLSKAGVGLFFPFSNNAYGLDITSFTFIVNKISDIQFSSIPIKIIIINAILLIIAYCVFYFYYINFKRKKERRKKKKKKKNKNI